LTGGAARRSGPPRGAGCDRSGGNRSGGRHPRRIGTLARKLGRVSRYLTVYITVLLVASSSLSTVEAMTLPDPDPEAVRRGRPGADHLICVADIRALFKLGRTAAYELTRRPGFPAPVQVSRRCLRWWASEVDAYAGALQREGAPRGTRRAATRETGELAAAPRRITGTVRAARGRREPA
jgi:predicted DNA-binding transcriptional regulator AlpA